MRRKFLRPDRIRAMKRYYWLVPPDFFKDEALSVLQPDELLLYFYLHLVADTFGIARQNDAAICDLLNISPQELEESREGLIGKDFIAHDARGTYQALSQPLEIGNQGFEELDLSVV